MSSPARLRMNRTALVPVALLALCTVPLAFAAGWTPVLLLIPIAVALWVLRVGVDVSEEGVTARSTFGQRHVPWHDVAGIRVAPRGDLRLVTTSATEIRLPVVRARDLPRLAEVSGGRIAVPAPPAQ
ncbi:PH domain-containing protein [Blastococcus tunisiensis]|uniref:PH domain-containing protein n=1 Tax=Blastococcus tunisiensis TaxID=1798228 RepID=A0A1I2CSU6_9ACTN|nr:PH domain-containing protein [Blastococcus sp. DSM 46838]SFE71417.1 PH domain-containing protein [Blastococcus sp. DSM 46838]